MSLNIWSELPPNRTRSLDAAPPQQPLLTLTYRSRATAPMTASTLNQLGAAAAARNRVEGVTGIVVYDEQRFYQWIEGPPSAVGRVWNSICRDPRHTDIEALSMHSAAFRLFGQWDLKVSTSRQDLFALQPPAPTTVDATAERLAMMTISSDGDAARALLRESFEQMRSLKDVTERLVEPAARALGDLWSDDGCDEYEMTLGLCRLQSYMRDLSAGSQPAMVAHPLVVLVAPLPGELHMLGASLGAEAVWQAGWETQVRFPTSADALAKIVATNWFDAVDLSLSPALSREHRLPNMEQIIASMRRASQNPALVVVTGGRAFFERSAASADVGADASHGSATNVVEAIEQALHGRE
jgi:methanogenic corrinoid protein MtbC1